MGLEAALKEEIAEALISSSRSMASAGFAYVFAVADEFHKALRTSCDCATARIGCATRILIELRRGGGPSRESR